MKALLTLAAASLIAAPALGPRRDPDSKPATQPADAPPPDAPVRVRPANQPLYERAKSLIDRVRAATERLARPVKPDEPRNRPEQLKRDIVEQYRALNQIAEIADELLLRGERDGFTVRTQADALKPPLDAAVAELRPSLGTAQGLSNTMIRRAKDQLAAVRRLDDLMKQTSVPQKWTSAYARYAELRDAAEEVGRFVDAKESDQIFRPLDERAAQIRPGYLIEKKASLDESLQQEFAAVRPNLDNLFAALANAARAAKESHAVKWDDAATTGPALIERLIDDWAKLDRAAVQATAVLHARGSPAEPELKSFAADYDAARTRTVALVRELILAETESLPAATLESRYPAYLDVIAKLMTAVRGTPDEFQPAATALNQLLAKSPALQPRVAAYRAATDETIRWRRRTVQQYLKSMHATHDQKPRAEPLAKLLDRPPPLPGQEGPAGLKRVNQTFWTLEQPPEFVARAWTDDWKNVAATAAGLRVLWASGADPRLISPWQRRACADTKIPRPTLVALADSLAKDLLVGPDRPPLTLEASLAIESALRGPFLELGGTINAVRVESLPDRLAEAADPLDLAGSLRTDALVGFPSLAASVRIELKPAWLAHELFFWSSAPAPAPASSPPQKPAADPKIASQPGHDNSPGDNSQRKSGDAPPTAPPPGNAAAPTPQGAAAAGGASSTGEAPKKLEPAKPPPAVPKGGVKF